MMTLTDVFCTAAAIIASLGGGTVIVFGLSNWLGKVWASRILEGEKAEHQKEIESYKSELQKEIERLSAIQDKALYISKAQYDNEYRIYQEIWGKLHACTVSTIRLYPGYEEVPTEAAEYEIYQENKYHNFVGDYNTYSTAIEAFAPFYKAELYNTFVTIRGKCNEMGQIFKNEEFDKKYNATFVMVMDQPMSAEDRRRTIDLRREIADIEDGLVGEIRNYLHSLRMIG